MTIDVRKADERFTRIDWLDSWHSFSFATHYDPANTHHGLLLVSNDDRVAPGQGFTTHSHRDMEIVTWVLEGELAHRHHRHRRDHPTGRGAAHERRAADRPLRDERQRSEGVHFVQMWVPPTPRGSTSYEQTDVSDDLATGGLVPVAGGPDQDAAVTIQQRDAALWAAQLRLGEEVVPARHTATCSRPAAPPSWRVRWPASKVSPLA